MSGGGVAFLKGAVIVPATAKHTATVIFLHGLGDTGHGWAEAMKSIASSHIKYICPTASIMPVTLNHGYRMPSWFDLYSLTSGVMEDENGIKEAAKGVHSVIDDEMQQGIASDRIMIGGFSQGGALALYSGYTYSKPLAGLVGLSCWMCLYKQLPKENSTIPVLQCHGDCDTTVSYQWGKLSSDYIKTFNNTSHMFNTYPGMMHSSCAKEMTDVKDFINKHLPADASKI
ncbi:acyl-protein thioesterase 1-like [Dysidea avara]|uniref:acyl-protein thioesterase 1-like n=1 Tax=Dysidea avara TaxID=196820 RepID=UPI00331D53D8